MKVSFTPGPWFVGHDDAHDCPPHKDSGLALVDTGRISDPPIARLCEWHNARLIAAAPCLYEALAEIVRLEDGNDAERYANKYLKVLQMCRAAIAKAEGRS